MTTTDPTTAQPATPRPQRHMVRTLVAEVCRLRGELDAAPAAPRTVLTDVAAERERQDAKWGEQNHPNGTGIDSDDSEEAEYWRGATETAAAIGELTWRHILHEEVAEAVAEHDPVNLRAEPVQVAAVAAEPAAATRTRWRPSRAARSSLPGAAPAS